MSTESVLTPHQLQQHFAENFSVSNHRISGNVILNQRFNHAELHLNFMTFNNITIEIRTERVELKNCEGDELLIAVLNEVKEIELINCKFNTIKIFRSDDPFENLYLRKLNFLGKTTTASHLSIIVPTIWKFEIIGAKFTKIRIGGNIKNKMQIRRLTLESCDVKHIKVELAEIMHLTAQAIKKIEMVFLGVTFYEATFDKTSDSLVSIYSSKGTSLGLSRDINLRLNIQNSEIEEIIVLKTEFQSITLSGKCNISIKKNASTPTDISHRAKINCKSLKFKNLSLSGHLVLAFFKIEEINLFYFINEGNFQFSHSEFDSIEIRNSTLGKTTFDNLTFDDGKLSLIDSNIDNTTFTNITWNTYLLKEDIKYDELRTNESAKVAVREAYRQLKSNYTKNQNKIEALQFQKRELLIHYSIVKDRLKDEKGAKKYWFNLGEFLILWTHKFASDFGQDIWRPIWIPILIHLALFNLMIWTNGNLGYHHSLNWYDWDLHSNIQAFKDYCYTALPTHGFALPKNPPVPIYGFIDVLMRISSGYFIFYFITASRKFHQ